MNRVAVERTKSKLYKMQLVRSREPANQDYEMSKNFHRKISGFWIEFNSSIDTEHGADHQPRGKGLRAVHSDGLGGCPGEEVFRPLKSKRSSALEKKPLANYSKSIERKDCVPSFMLADLIAV